MALIQLNGIQGQSLPTVGDITNVATLGDLSDVSISAPSSGQVLKYSGTGWVNSSDSGLTEIVQDTTPQLGGDLDPNGFNIIGNGGLSLKATTAHQFLRATTNDNNGVLQFAKDTSGLNESLLLKALVAFRAHNSTSQHTVAHIYAERLSDANPSRQLVLGLYTDTGARTDVLRIARDSGSVDSVNILAGLTTQAITAVGNVNITGSINQTGTGVDLVSTSTGVNITSSTTLDLTSTAELNIDAFKMVTNAPMDMTIDNITTTIPNAVLMNTLLPNTKDIANFMSAYMDYGTDALPLQTQATFTFGVKKDTFPSGKITGRLVSTYNETSDITNMQMRAYDVNSNTHYDLSVNKNEAYSTVPFRYPSISLTTYTGATNAGMVLFDTDDNKLKCYDGTTWQALF